MSRYWLRVADTHPASVHRPCTDSSSLRNNCDRTCYQRQQVRGKVRRAEVKLCCSSPCQQLRQECVRNLVSSLSAIQQLMLMAKAEMSVTALADSSLPCGKRSSTEYFRDGFSTNAQYRIIVVASPMVARLNYRYQRGAYSLRHCYFAFLYGWLSSTISTLSDTVQTVQSL